MVRALSLLVLSCVVAAAAAEAKASLVRTEVDAVVDAAGDDLLETHLAQAPTLTKSWTKESASGAPAALTDGVACYAGGSTAPRYKQEKAMYGAPETGATVTFSLDTAAHPMGYEITQIDFYHGWGDDGRDGFQFRIEYATVDDPGVFILYGDTGTKYDPPANYGRSEITDSAGAIADAVAALRFTIVSVDAGYGGLAEIDVFGSPMPEPGTLALAVLGGAALALRRRRQGRAAGVAQVRPGRPRQPHP